MFQETAQHVAALIGISTVAFLAITGAAWAGVKIVGQRWMENAFNKKLEAFKHGQQQELERLRFEMNAAMDRATKLHQREFEMLPASWAQLSKAYNSVRDLVSPMQSYANVRDMNVAELDELLADAKFSELERQTLREASGDERQNIYQELRVRYRLSEVRSLCVASNIDIDAHGIFMQEDLKQKFKTVSDLLWDALIEFQFNLQHSPKPRMRKHYDALDKQGPTAIADLELAVRQRLWSGAIGPLKDI
jgi:hypothetical protein